MFRLDTIVSQVKKKKRRGRGGSRGGTSGKGHKGQHARSGGGVRIGFEGGQTPLLRRLPKRGFTNARFAQVVEIVNLEAIERLFVDGDVITKQDLVVKGIVHARGGRLPLIKVLSNGSLSKKITLQADFFSKEAVRKIEAVGGKVEVVSN